MNGWWSRVAGVARQCAAAALHRRCCAADLRTWKDADSEAWITLMGAEDASEPGLLDCSKKPRSSAWMTLVGCARRSCAKVRNIWPRLHAPLLAPLCSLSHPRNACSLKPRRWHAQPAPRDTP